MPFARVSRNSFSADAKIGIADMVECLSREKPILTPKNWVVIFIECLDGGGVSYNDG